MHSRNARRAVSFYTYMYTFALPRAPVNKRAARIQHRTTRIRLLCACTHMCCLFIYVCVCAHVMHKTICCAMCEQIHRARAAEWTHLLAAAAHELCATRQTVCAYMFRDRQTIYVSIIYIPSLEHIHITAKSCRRALHLITHPTSSLCGISKVCALHHHTHLNIYTRKSRRRVATGALIHLQPIYVYR